MDSMAKKSRIQPLAIETQRVISRLRGSAIGEVVTWEEIEALTCRPRSRAYGLVKTAMRTLLDSDRMHFVTNTGVGVERVDDADVARETVPKQIRRMSGAARKVIKTTSSLVLDKLGDQERVSVIGAQTIGHLVKHACDKRTVKQLASGEARRLSPLSPREAMERLLNK